MPPVYLPNGLPTYSSTRAALQTYAYTQNSSYLDIAIKATEDVINNSGVSLTTLMGCLMKQISIIRKSYGLTIVEKKNTIIANYEELMRTYPNISTDNVNNSQKSDALKQANGQSFEDGPFFPYPRFGRPVFGDR